MRREIVNRWWAVVLLLCVTSAAGAADRIIYVDAAATGAQDGTSWTDAYVRLQDAFTEIAALSMPVEIRIARGTYRASDGGRWDGRTTATYELRNGLALAGGYAGVRGSDPNARDVDRYETVLSGARTNDDDAEPPDLHDSCRVVVTGRDIDESVVLDGLTISHARNYGMELHEASPSLAQCRFVDNGFSGIHAWDCNSVLSGCTFERNGFGTLSHGGINCVRGNLTLTDCAFIENDGGGIENSETLDLLRCSFVANTATGATAIDHSGILTARKCVFLSNESVHGAAVEYLKTATLIDCTFTDNTSRWAGAVRGAGDLTLTNCQFTGNSGGSFAGAVTTSGDTFRAEGCLFAGNRSLLSPGAIYTTQVAIVCLSKCTFAGNRGWPNAFEHISLFGHAAELRQCIVWDGPEPFTKFAEFPPEIAASYSTIEGGYEGQGNIDADPGFVAPGRWDDRGTPDDPNDDFWVTGDYHLRSQAGHWDRQTESWVLDDVTSPCIDAGDPNAPLGLEPFPNGGFVNIGAYGGSGEASRSYFGAPVCQSQLAGDINGDCKVDDLDVDILMSHWLMDATVLENAPPSITLISPHEGDEFALGAPIVFQAQASDPDGTVIRVSYHFAARWENGSASTGATATDPTDNWKATLEWQPPVTIPPDATYTIQAEALDDRGAKTVTPEVEITLNP